MCTVRRHSATWTDASGFVEALKFAFAARTSFGDPAFVDNAHRWREIAEKSYARQLLGRISDNRTHAVDSYNPEFATREVHGTTHISAVDSRGGAASLSTTVNLIFGSRVLCPETGVIFKCVASDRSNAADGAAMS